MLLVANERTRQALGKLQGPRVRYLSENAVDTEMWTSKSTDRKKSTLCRFIFVGRLIPSKGVDLWLRAFQQVSDLGSPVTAT